MNGRRPMLKWVLKKTGNGAFKNESGIYICTKINQYGEQSRFSTRRTEKGTLVYLLWRVRCSSSCFFIYHYSFLLHLCFSPLGINQPGLTRHLFNFGDVVNVFSIVSAQEVQVLFCQVKTLVLPKFIVGYAISP